MESPEKNCAPFVVSAVRDFEMYDKCVGKNPNLDAFRKIAIHNNAQNLSISRRYNWFIDKFLRADDCWAVFCHEDWRPDEDLAAVLEGLDPGKIYGPVGIFLQHRRFRDVFYEVGRVTECRKDGSGPVLLEFKMPRGRVDTLDCQCVIVHSSLIRRYGLRFDDRLKFDMYVEDFCAAAHEKYGVRSEVRPIRCTHFSPGVLGESFSGALSYVRGKYRNARKGYLSIAGYKSWFGYRNLRTDLHHTRFPRLAGRLNAILDGRNI